MIDPQKQKQPQHVSCQRANFCCKTVKVHLTSQRSTHFTRYRHTGFNLVPKVLSKHNLIQYLSFIVAQAKPNHYKNSRKINV